ncbi:type 1 glutamine amidotransferase domain-containing protein [Actinomycetospora sp.]|jgi:protease I|uniref:type 1 glutamine amidotransferase domain-containing protein n=1 Tax=Actinomycetospora sp. TaxID=1872135 RepID=UPI002F421B74
MANELSGKRIAILAASGVEQVELTRPRQAAEDAGATTTLVSVDTGEIQAMNADINKGDTFAVDASIDAVSADDFDAVILPGGTCNPDTLRQNADVIAFVQAIAGSGKQIAAICHAPWTLVEADLVRGKRLTSFPSVRTDIRNAGGTVVDEQVVVDQGLITSRNPDDLDAFCATLVKEFA